MTVWEGFLKEAKAELRVERKVGVNQATQRGMTKHFPSQRSNLCKSDKSGGIGMQEWRTLGKVGGMDMQEWRDTD